jgi:hypothetical protein
VVPDKRGLLVVIAVGEDMVDGLRVHSEQQVALEDRVQYCRYDVGRPTDAVKQALVFHRAPILFHPFIKEYRVVLLVEVSENDMISLVKVYHDDRYSDTQHSKCLAGYHKSSLFPRDRVDGVLET